MQWNDGVRGSTYQIRTSHCALRYDHRKPGITALQALPFQSETTAHEMLLPDLRAVEMSCAVQSDETSHPDPAGESREVRYEASLGAVNATATLLFRFAVENVG